MVIIEDLPKIYTSYFAKLKQLPEDIFPVAICRKAPAWYQGAVYQKLAPTYPMFTLEGEAFDRKYKKEILQNLSIEEVLSELKQLSHGKDICLFCYEKDPEDCHRLLVAEWLRGYGINCLEYDFMKKTMTM